MPKKKKTRKQKILADARHRTAGRTTLAQMEKFENQLSQSEYKPQPRLDLGQQTSLQSIVTSHYQYIYSDLVKTAVLTFSIVVGELVLRYLFF